MKRLFVIILVIAAIALTACGTGAGNEPTEPPVQYSVTELIGYNPNTYEVHYRTTFSNGLVIDRWTQVSREEYEREVESDIEK